MFVSFHLCILLFSLLFRVRTIAFACAAQQNIRLFPWREKQSAEQCARLLLCCDACSNHMDYLAVLPKTIVSLHTSLVGRAGSNRGSLHRDISDTIPKALAARISCSRKCVLCLLLNALSSADTATTRAWPCHLGTVHTVNSIVRY